MTEIHTDRLILRKAISEQEKISLVSQIGDWEVVKWLAKSLPSKYRFQLDGARELLLSGKSEQARETLQTVIVSSRVRG